MSTMSTIRILSEKFVDSLDEDLADLAMSDNPGIRREARRLRTLINRSSRQNGGPAAISNEQYQALVILLGKERLP